MPAATPLRGVLHIVVVITIRRIQKLRVHISSRQVLRIQIVRFADFSLIATSSSRLLTMSASTQGAAKLRFLFGMPASLNSSRITPEDHQFFLGLHSVDCCLNRAKLARIHADALRFETAGGLAKTRST